MTCHTMKIFIFCIFVFIVSAQTNDNVSQGEFRDDLNEDTSATNKPLPTHLTTQTTNITTRNSSSSLLIKALSNKNISINSTHRANDRNISKKNVSTTALPKRNLTTTTSVVPSPYVLASYLVDQFNHYRNVDILSRIKRCNPNLKLHEICEMYSFDNHTYSLIREFNVEFPTLRNVYDSLVDQVLVDKLKNFCLPGQWCLTNISQNDINYTINVIRKQGYSLCSLEKCTSRLNIHAVSCPMLTPRNISTPTLKILPMLCKLYEEQQSWSSDTCMDEIVRLFHILYAFWPQLETCYNIIAAGSGGCTSECLTFEELLQRVENQCNGNPLFLSRISTLAWYRSANLKYVCRDQNIISISPLISSVKNAISSSLFWYRLHERPAYALIFIIIIICIVMSFSLCLYMMSKNDINSEHRHLDDDYEYTRLHDSAFDLGANTSTEIPNMESISDRTLNRSQFELNNNHRFSENQRLLYAQS